MPILSKPAVKIVGISDDRKRKLYAVTFAFDFTTEPCKVVTDAPLINGYPFPSAEYTLDFSGLNLPENFANFKSLCFSQAFNAAGYNDYDVDGPLIINVPGTGQTFVIAPPYSSSPVAGTFAQEMACVSGCIPLWPGSTPRINFYKGAMGITPDPTDEVAFGPLWVTMYDFEMPAWTQSGIGLFANTF